MKEIWLENKRLICAQVGLFERGNNFGQGGVGQVVVELFTNRDLHRGGEPVSFFMGRDNKTQTHKMIYKHTRKVCQMSKVDEVNKSQTCNVEMCSPAQTISTFIDTVSLSKQFIC